MRIASEHSELRIGQVIVSYAQGHEVPVYAGRIISVGPDDVLIEAQTPNGDEFTREIGFTGKNMIYILEESPCPPMPTTACVIRARVRGPVPFRILFGHPNPGESEMTFCRAEDGVSYTLGDVIWFEILWVDES